MGLALSHVYMAALTTLLSLLLTSVPCTASAVPRCLQQRRLSSSGSRQCAVVFDAGSTGSRVHVYCFNPSMELVKFGDGYELFRKTTPGLSAYADTPEKGAESLTPLLNEAIDAVPAGQRSITPIRLGATAGLRLLQGDSASNLLKVVSALFAKSPFKFEPQWVSILDGTQEGGFSWVAINYLLGKIGKDYGGTIGTVDLGGGSLQMAYAVSDDTANNVPKAIQQENSYITELNLLGKPYHLYVHSYLGFGLLAGRAEVLKLVNKSQSCPCVAKGYQGEYVYDSVTYKAVGSAHGSSYKKCEKLILKALGVKDSCKYSPCTFGGVWSGGGGAGQKNLYVASLFFERAMEGGIIADPTAIEARVKPADFGRLARRVCQLDFDEIKARYPSLIEDARPYFCLDLVYEYTLLTKAFGLDKHQDITLVSQIDYKNSTVEAQWALGSAIDVLSSKS